MFARVAENSGISQGRLEIFHPRQPPWSAANIPPLTGILIDLYILDFHFGKTLEFHKDDQKIFIQGNLPGPQKIFLHSLELLASHSHAVEFYELVPLDRDEQSAALLLSAEPEFPQDLPGEIRQVLDEFRWVFDLPEKLPLARPFDHKIHLLPHTKPVNERP